MKRGTLGFYAFFWLFITYLCLPLVMMILMSFKDSRFIGFPIQSWTLKWYVGLANDEQMLWSIGYSTTIAIISTLVSIALSVWTAMFLGPVRFRGKLLFFALLCLPAVMPGVISAISLRIFIRAIGLEPGMTAIVLSQIIHNVPFATLMILARLNALPLSQVEAARDLGSNSLDAFRRITLPFLMPAVFGAGVFCMLLSFDDFVRAFFLGGYEPTMMVLLFSKLRAGMSPDINAVSTVVLVLSAAAGLWAERAVRNARRGAG